MAYFLGLIFAVCPEHVIIVAYCLDFCGLIFVWALSVTKIKPNENVLLYGICNRNLSCNYCNWAT